MEYVLVTGANKGIGLAIVDAILSEQADYGVILASRDLDRGGVAVQTLLQKNPGWQSRLRLMALDVSDTDSVNRAAQQLREAGMSLYGLVNNAGIASGSLKEILDVNVRGIHRVCQAFVPLICSGGSLVNVASASGPNFVSNCSPERQQFFTDPSISWSRIEGLLDDCLHMGPEEFYAQGLADGSAYGLSKACVNSYSMLLAREHTDLTVNACTPGFIRTDLTIKMIADSGRNIEEMGLKMPAEGARVVMFLLFGQPQGSGHYYGSDGLRSPLDRYRAPGSSAYSGG